MKVGDQIKFNRGGKRRNGTVVEIFDDGSVAVEFAYGKDKHFKHHKDTLYVVRVTL